jgi:hypothetical protein
MRVTTLVVLAIALHGCAARPAAELLLVGGRVYTLSWPDPDGEGRPNAAAPFDAAGCGRTPKPSQSGTAAFFSSATRPAP